MPADVFICDSCQRCPATLLESGIAWCRDCMEAHRADGGEEVHLCDRCRTRPSHTSLVRHSTWWCSACLHEHVESCRDCWHIAVAEFCTPRRRRA